jgi:VPS62-like protein
MTFGHWIVIAAVATIGVTTFAIGLEVAIRRLKRDGLWGLSVWRRLTFRLAQLGAVTLALLIPAGCAASWYYGASELSLSPGKPAPPYFAHITVASVSSELKGAGFRCSPIGGSVLRSCLRKSGTESIEVILFGATPDRIDKIAVRAATAQQDPEEWLPLALNYLPSRSLRRKAMKWAMRNREHIATTTFGGYGFQLFGRPKLPALAVDSPGEHPGSIRDLLAPKPPSVAEGYLLARRFAPVLRYGHGEHFRPTDISAYGEFTHVCQVELTVRRKIPFTTYDPPTVSHCSETKKGNLPTLDCSVDSDRCNLSLLADGVDPTDVDAHVDLEVRVREKSPQPKYTVYWYPARTTSSRIVLEYWFFYSYNAFTNRHEGDWEWVGVDIDDSAGPFNALPVKVYYSTHHAGRWRLWSELRADLNKIGDHPVIYVATGSHANYPNPGSYAVLECASDSGPCFGGPDHAAGDGCELGGTGYRLVELTGPAFPATYGAANYLGPRNQITGTGPDDPRAHPYFKDPEVAFKDANHDSVSVKNVPAPPACQPDS